MKRGAYGEHIKVISNQLSIIDNQLKMNQQYDIDFSTGTKLMGIVNVTPDSFYDGGKYSFSLEATVNHAFQLINDGADILDIGGESSRPGAEPVSAEEEASRVLPVIELVRENSAIPISVDTYKPKVAKKALSAGANWINDITGIINDETMLNIAAEEACPVIVMHMQGKPQTMQENPLYKNVVDDLLDFFEKRISVLQKNGIIKIILDPGIGFGKTVAHNLEILHRIDEFKQFDLPVMIGASRKSFIGKILNEEVEHRLAGSLAVLNWSFFKDVDLIRVHDVKESKQSLKILTAIKMATN